MAKSDKEKADVLCDFFTKVFTKEDLSNQMCNFMKVWNLCQI